MTTPSGIENNIVQDSVESAARRAWQESDNLVLVAEDDEGIALALEVLIEDAGYRVVHAMHGEQALALARELHPALVITDFMMPRMNGAQFIEMLHQDATEHGHKLPRIVLMTAARAPSTDDIVVDAFLPKPFDIEQVLTLLHRFMPNPDPSM